MNIFRLILVLTLCFASAAIAQTSPTPDYVLVGTYTNTDAHSAGIYVYTFDAQTGAFAQHGQMGGITNPSFLAYAPDHKFVYAVGETDGNGLVFAYAFDAKTGKLTPLNQQSAGGNGPCHLTVDATGRWLLVGNYGGGNLSVLPIRADGSLAAPQQTIQHTGSGPDPDRQTAPHVHQVVLAPNNRDVLVPDLGTDRVMHYLLDDQTGKLTTASPVSISGTAGGGPRHLIRHPNGTVYLLEEMSGKVVVFSNRNDQLVRQQTISALPSSYTGAAAGAEVVLSPDGRFLYASLRGNNTLAQFSIDQKGILAYVGSTPVGGNGPRHFTLDRTGRWLLVANQRSNTVTRFRRDIKSGNLTAFGEPVSVPAPTCLLPALGK